MLQLNASGCAYATDGGVYIDVADSDGQGKPVADGLDKRGGQHVCDDHHRARALCRLRSKTASEVRDTARGIAPRMTCCAVREHSFVKFEVRSQPLPDLGYDFKAFTVEVSLLGKLRAHTEQIATVASASLSASPTAPSAQDRATGLHDSRALELLRSHTTGDPQLAAPSRTFCSARPNRRQPWSG